MKILIQSSDWFRHIHHPYRGIKVDFVRLDLRNGEARAQRLGFTACPPSIVSYLETATFGNVGGKHVYLGYGTAVRPRVISR